MAIQALGWIGVRTKNAEAMFIYPEPQRQAGQAWQHFRAPDGNVYELIGPDDVGVVVGEGNASQ